MASTDPWATEKRALRTEKEPRPFIQNVALLLLQRDEALDAAVKAVEPRVLELALTRVRDPESRLKAIKALVTLKTPSLANKLAPLMGDPASDIVGAAAKAMGARVRSPEAVTVLLGKLAPSDSWQSREYGAVRALKYFDDPRVVPALLSALGHPEGAVGREALYGLALLKAPEALEPFVELLATSREAQKVAAAASGLAALGGKKAEAALSDEKLYARALKLAEDPVNGRFGTRALGHFRVPRAVDDLVKLVTRSEDAEVIEAAVSGLVDQGAQPAIAPIAARVMKSSDPTWVGRHLVRLMLELGKRAKKPDPKAIAALAKVLDEAKPRVIAELREGTDQLRYEIDRFTPEESKRFEAWSAALCKKLKKNKTAIPTLLRSERSQ